ncbi:MAG: PilZ domain-containing protein [Pseudomonadota bacterium]
MNQDGGKSDVSVERRAIERVQDDIPAVYVNKDGDQIECKIIDFSLMGACVQFQAPVDLSEVIKLRLPELGLEYDAELRWQSGVKAGVLFLDGRATKN